MNQDEDLSSSEMDEDEHSNSSSTEILDEFENDAEIEVHENEENVEERGLDISDEELLPIDPEAHSSYTVAYHNEFLTSPLSKAIFAKDFQKIQELLKIGNGLDSRDNNGFTPLHIAVIVNNIDILDLLLKHPNIDLNAAGNMGETSLILSLKLKRSEQFIMKLIEAGCDVNIANTEQETPLHLAAHYGFPLVTESLIKYGANINATDYCGFTPLHEAATQSNLEIVQMLLYYNADATLKCIDKLTPFMRSISNRNEDHRIAFELLEYEADINNLTIDGYNSLLLALNSFNPIAMELIERGADVNVLTPYRHSALHLAMYWDNSRMFKVIWPKIKKELLLSSQTPFLNSYFFNCNFRLDDWVDCLYTIIDSSVFSQLIKQHLHWFDFFVKLTETFVMRNVPENYRVCLIRKFLSLGVPVTLTGFTAVYKRYGHNEEVEALLTVNIHLEKVEKVIPKLAVFLRDKEQVAVKEFLKQPISSCNIMSFLKEFLEILRYFAPIKCFKHKYRKKVPRIKEIIRKYGHKPLKPVNRYICKKLQEMCEIPSLLELSRRAARLLIRQKCKGKNSLQQHMFLNNLELPQHLKDIIKFKTPLYQDPEVCIRDTFN